MLAGQSGLVRVVGSGVLVTDVVFLHAALLRGIYSRWGLPLFVQILAAAASGLIAIVFFGGARLPRVQGFASIAASCCCWAVAGFLTDWAFSDAIGGRYLMPQWWVTTYRGPGCASGLAFLGGQAVAGTVAGLGLLGPIIFNARITLARRVTWSLGLALVAAASWMAAFHGRWVS